MKLYSSKVAIAFSSRHHFLSHSERNKSKRWTTAELTKRETGVSLKGDETFARESAGRRQLHLIRPRKWNDRSDGPTLEGFYFLSWPATHSRGWRFQESRMNIRGDKSLSVVELRIKCPGGEEKKTTSTCSILNSTKKIDTDIRYITRNYF